MFDDTKVVVRQNIDDFTVGAAVLLNFTACNSDWLSDDYTLVEGEMTYNADEDTVLVTMNNGSKTIIEGAELEGHLVKVEIVAVKELEGEE